VTKSIGLNVRVFSNNHKFYI